MISEIPRVCERSREVAFCDHAGGPQRHRWAPWGGAGSSGAVPPHDTPGAQRPRTAAGRAPPRSADGPGSPFSLGQLLEHRLVWPMRWTTSKNGTARHSTSTTRLTTSRSHSRSQQRPSYENSSAASTTPAECPSSRANPGGDDGRCQLKRDPKHRLAGGLRRMP